MVLPILTPTRKNMIIAGLTLVLIAVTAGIIIQNTLSSKKNKSNLAAKLVYPVSSAIGDRHHVNFKLIVPYNNQREKQALKLKLKNINHELIITGSHPQIEKILEEKDYNALETHILGIAHNIIMIPAEQLALEDLSLREP